MELTLLRSFAVLAEHLHFGRAARVLHLRQPALTKQMRRLEDELGGALLERGTHLGWTALLECVLLGDGGKKYQEIAQILKDAGADVHLRDRDGIDALEHVRRKAYHEIVNILSR